ncbi:DNA polymerase III subunit delta' [Shewanella surugensis]|uniref:DNA-directed DNA polymerase n=1 Tax=Shewanella surugensis TaxID=212020 RepID=A0ABT0L6Y1_9GAMM|nr:DNA polymerase III subunit delta' [Shewanella surugensis]MCL1123454.1 DNA polymerase III subunit delta' [Shewanella surugensis]
MPANVVPWIDKALSQFCLRLKQNNYGHAYLIGLEKGYGGDLLGLDMAKSLLCDKATARGGCGFCKACQLFEANNHPDFYLIKADGHQIKVDQIRDLCQRLTATAQQGGRRVALLLNSERLNIAAANALLKTLEEPGKETVLLLQSDTPSRLMATISSRCQRMDVPLPTLIEIKSWLKQQADVLQDVTWCLPVVGGPIALAHSLKAGEYARLLCWRKAWAQSLSSGRLSNELMNLDEQQVLDAINILFLVLKQKLIKQVDLDAMIRMKIVDFSTHIMQQYHQLKIMPNINIPALFKGFIADYQQIVT